MASPTAPGTRSLPMPPADGKPELRRLQWADPTGFVSATAGDSSKRLTTTPMLFVNCTVFIVAGLVVGRLVTQISGNRIAALVVALFYLIYMVMNHYISVWDELPAWYNLVPAIVSGAIIVGSRIAPSAAKTSS